jgi:hypothetical protein
MPLTNGTNSSFKLRKIDTASSTTPPSRSHSTSPIQGTTVTDYCESPDTLLPQSVTGAGGGNRSSPRTRRRDTSPTTSNNVTTTVIGMSSQQQSVPVPPVRRSSTRSEIPFIGGGFSSSSNSSSSRPLLTKRASHSSNGIGGLWSCLSGGHVRASSRKNRWSRLIGLLATLILVCWLVTGWRENVAPRRKLNERWWEIEESELSPGKAQISPFFLVTFRNLSSTLLGLSTLTPNWCVIFQRIYPPCCRNLHCRLDLDLRNLRLFLLLLLLLSIFEVEVTLCPKFSNCRRRCLPLRALSVRQLTLR